jgi:hypothetical protein
MENDIIAAINVMRKKLDEIEKMVRELPVDPPTTNLTSSYSPSPRFHDWCQLNGIEKDYRLRSRLYVIARLADEGLTVEQILEHRRIRQKKTILPLVKEFYTKWNSRKAPANADDESA